MDANLQFLQNLIIALLLGSLIGVEREKDHHDNGEHAQHEFGGIRTMSLVGMLGFLVHEVFSTNLVMLATFTGAFLVLLVASYVVSSNLNKNSGATTELAAIFTYIMGILVARDQLLYAASVTLIVVLLLYFKEKLHDFAHHVEKNELYDAIKFIAVVFVVLPILPNKTYDQFGVVNPYMIWLIVVLISTISFLSYVVIKAIGAKKGIGAMGFFGGLISSTAVVINFSELSKKTKKIIHPFVIGILLASVAMFTRTLLEISFINSTLFSLLIVPFSLMGVTAILLSVFFWFRGRGDNNASYSDKDLALKSPLQLGTAIKFSLLLTSLLFVTAYVSKYYGNGGIYITSFLTGLMDVDAITVSMGNLSLKGEVTAMTATTAISIAVMTNTITKGFIVFFFASRPVALRTILSVFLVVGVGVVTLIVYNPNFYGTY